MKTFLLSLLKMLATRKALEAILEFLRWLVDKTPNKWDDEVYTKLEQIYNLLYPIIPEKRRK
jgi:hypothetical protein